MAFTSRARRSLVAQGNDLANKAAVDLTAALFTRLLTDTVCTRPNVDPDLCKVFDDVANENAQKFQSSALTLGIWGGLALCVALWEGVSSNCHG